MIPLWKKISNFTSKNTLKTLVSNKELCNTGSFPTSPGSLPHEESSIMPSRRVLRTNVKGEAGNFSLVSYS
jgi:hypothetical protein